MLVIVSDLHLTDGSAGTSIDKDAFKIFHERLKDLAYAASVRETNNTTNKGTVYIPVEDIYLLLLGDVLDVIRSAKWLEGNIRPWSEQDARFVNKVREITDGILQNNRDALDVMQSLHKDGVRIPIARDGKPDDTETQKVDVHTHYMIGNHDWFFHLRGPGFDQIRASIVQALGLDNKSDEPFPHDPNESQAIRKLYEEHQVFARHGDIFDDTNFENSNRDQSSLGDAVVVELLGRFPREVERELGPQAAQGLREIDNVRPLELIPNWVDGLLRKRPDPNQAMQVRKIWNRVATDFLNIDFVKRHHSALKWGLFLSEGMSFRRLAEIIPLGKKLLTSFRSMGRLSLSDDFYTFASKEQAFRDPKFSYIVYGHTHHHEVIPLRAGKEHNGIDQVVYINSGTWRAVFDLARVRPRDEEFFGYHVMTYLAFFKGTERKGKAFETWSGSLEENVAA